MIADLPKEMVELLELISRTTDTKLKQFGYKLLSSHCNRYGFRWEYFV